MNGEDIMYLIAGLGNPGVEYEHTRHNVGFDVIDMLSSRYNIPINREKFKGIYGEGIISSEKVMLIKPGTYMNLSGQCIAEAANFYKLDCEKIIIIHDDISIDCGRMRIRTHGSSGGHNGIKSIIATLADDSFTRIKIGVGQPENDLVSFVLGRFSDEDRKKVEKTFAAACDSIESIIREGTDEAMNRFNCFMAD